MDTLIDFYNNGKITIVKQIGSRDDSVAVANTEALKKKNRKITNEQLLEYYEKGMNLVLSIDINLLFKDKTLIHNSTLNDFSNAKTKKFRSNERYLKVKPSSTTGTYYVRVRAYRDTEKKIVYGAWSDTFEAEF